jgi:hypothetical protein
MSWASRRRFLILSLLGGSVHAGIAIFSIAIFYEVPTCTDGILNQDERDVDCGGVCARICPADAKPPSVLFPPRALPVVFGRVDIFTLIENPNAFAYAHKAEYEIELFDENQILIQTLKGSVSLPPRATVPIFIPNIASGERAVSRAFLTFVEPVEYERAEPIEQTVFEVRGRRVLQLDRAEPRITTEFENTDTKDKTNVVLIASLYNEDGTAFAAARAVVSRIPALGSASAVFTWPGALSSTPARIEIVPVLPDPS